jgi:hypothetical protein
MEEDHSNALFIGANENKFIVREAIVRPYWVRFIGLATQEKRAAVVEVPAFLLV